MITINNLYFKYVREYFSLYDINIQINKNETVALIGEEESGKTTLLRILAKLESYDKGEIYVKQISLKKLRYANDVALAYLPSVPIFYENKSVYENFKYILTVQKFPPEQIDKKIDDVLAEYKVENLKDVIVRNLSLFDKYLLSIIRACLRQLEIVLIDEILDNLEGEQQQIIFDLIKEKFAGQTTLVIATKSAEIAEKLEARKIHFKSGSIVEVNQ